MAMQTPDEPVGNTSTPSRSTFRIFAILTALYLSLFVAALDQTIVATAIPTMTSQLHSAAGYTWIGGAYLLAKVAVIPIWSKLSDIWGRRPMLLATLALFFLIHGTGEYRWLLQAGMLVATLGVALWCVPGLPGAGAPLATVVGLQVLAGAGVGLRFETPVIAVQAAVAQDDAATATATLSLLRNLANALSVVVGGVVFQNGVARRRGALVEAGVDEGMAGVLAGPEAAANRWAARAAFAGGLRDVWILYAAVAAVGVVASVFVKRNVLSDEHTGTRTGIEKRDDGPVGAAS